MIEEIWRPIQDCPDYSISNFGNVKNIKTNYLLKINSKIDRYTKVTLKDNNKNKTCSIHRLVGIAFIDNPENKPTINHINRMKNDNRIENLEWSTMSEQNFHKNIGKEKQIKITNYRPVWKINLQTNEKIERYKSIQDAALWVTNNTQTCNKSINSKICAVANNHRPHAYGYKWQYDNGTDLDNEIWKEIPLYLTNNKPNYFISNLGRYKNTTGRIITNYKYSLGYIRLGIESKNYLLHRLVALTFIDNPEDKEQVNHIDGNKLNNRLDNLEWCSCLENNIHKINIGLSNCTRKVVQYDLQMNKLNEFNSIKEAAKFVGRNVSCISNCCRGKQKMSDGFIFKYFDINPCV